MKVYTVSFFGHRIVPDPIAAGKQLESIVSDLLRTKEYVEFLVGRDGEFDLIAAAVVKWCQRNIRTDNSALVWIMPYVTAAFQDNVRTFQRYYDEIELCEDAAKAFPNMAFQIRNRRMIDRSDLVVCYTEHNSGGAYQAKRYAKSKGKAVSEIWMNPPD